MNRDPTNRPAPDAVEKRLRKDSARLTNAYRGQLCPDAIWSLHGQQKTRRRHAAAITSSLALLLLLTAAGHWLLEPAAPNGATIEVPVQSNRADDATSSRVARSDAPPMAEQHPADEPQIGLIEVPGAPSPWTDWLADAENEATVVVLPATPDGPKEPEYRDLIVIPAPRTVRWDQLTAAEQHAIQQVLNLRPTPTVTVY